MSRRTRHPMTPEQRRRLLGRHRATLAYSISAYTHLAETPVTRIPVDGGALNQLRNDRGWSQLALATRAGLAQSMICRLEHEETRTVTPDVLARLAGVLGVSVEELAK